MVPFVSGDPTEDFWKQNPQLKAMSPFSELVKKKNGSKIMWAIHLWKDPKSPWNRIGVTDKKTQVESDFLKGKISLDKYDKYAETYAEKCLSIKEKAYIKWEEDLQSLQKHYNDLDWSERKEKTEMLKVLPKLWDALNKAEADAAEELKYKVKGNRIESLIETGDI